MNKKWKKGLAGVLAAAMLFGCAVPVFADEIPEGEEFESEEIVIGEEDKPYIALGANLSSEERAKVLELLGVTEADLEHYDVVEVTNAQEHEYLDSYISADKIGTRALSSVVVMEGEKGSGINVTTRNISYCTTGMYENALATAGFEDAEVIVAGPFQLSGTAALIGAIEAYSVMTGDKIDEEVIDGAIEEIVVTGAIEESTGSTEEVEGMIAYLKEELADSKNLSDAELQNEIELAAEQFGVALDQSEIDRLISLLKKLQGLDLDWDKLSKQAQGIYDSLKDKGLDLSNLKLDQIDTDKIVSGASGFFGKIIAFFRNLFHF